MPRIKNLKHKDRRKIIGRLNNCSRIVLVLQRNGGLRVYDLDSYVGHSRHMRAVIHLNKPWIKRQKPLLGPMGARSLGAPNHLSRREIYEES